MRTDRENFLDEDVLRIQNEVRRYKDEQGIYDGNVNDKVQRSDGAGTNSDTVPVKSRGDFVQDAPAATKRK